MLKRPTVMLFCAFVFAAGIINHAVFADTIKLKNGREISGSLVEITEDDVYLMLGGGKVWFGKGQVESINNLSWDEARAIMSTAKAFVLGDKDKAISSSAREGEVFISKTRNLTFKSSPGIEVLSQQRLKEQLKKEIGKDFGPEKIDARAKLLKKLGLISNIEEYKGKILELSAEEVAAYYNPEDKKIYADQDSLGPILPSMPSITILHEQVHALQDQYYNLKDIEGNILLADEDKGLAIQSVIEGEATVLMYDAFFRGSGVPRDKFDLRSFVIDSMLSYSKRFKTAEGKSAVFVEDLLFPYVWGGSFIQHIVNTKGWEAVDSLYKDMPVSSEQIMHPEKYYIVRDAPMEVVFPSLSSVLGNSWVKISGDTLGEFGFYLSEKNLLDELSSKMASEGWGGDRYELYEELVLKKTLFISISKWDTQKDADESFQIYKKVIDKKYPQKVLVKEDLDFSQWKSENENIYISKSKDSVLIIEGATDDIMEKLLGALTI